MHNLNTGGGVVLELWVYIVFTWGIHHICILLEESLVRLVAIFEMGDTAIQRPSSTSRRPSQQQQNTNPHTDNCTAERRTTVCALRRLR